MRETDAPLTGTRCRVRRVQVGVVRNSQNDSARRRKEGELKGQGVPPVWSGTLGRGIRGEHTPRYGFVRTTATSSSVRPSGVASTPLSLSLSLSLSRLARSVCACNFTSVNSTGRCEPCRGCHRRRAAHHQTPESGMIGSGSGMLPMAFPSSIGLRGREGS